MNLQDSDWNAILAEEFGQPYFKELAVFLKREYAEYTVFPPRGELFAALRLTPFAEVKVVILGQDPYIGAGQAQGLAFSVREGVRIPPSLQNILKELSAETGIPPASSGDLTAWAKRGVLLLNTALTVREGMSDSHKGVGWERFTDRIISLINDKETPVVFLLWGNNAGKKRALITNKKHLILTAAHPSPLSASRGFFGCGHFSKTVEFLAQNGIDFSWEL